MGISTTWMCTDQPADPHQVDLRSAQPSPRPANPGWMLCSPIFVAAPLAGPTYPGVDARPALPTCRGRRVVAQGRRRAGRQQGEMRSRSLWLLVCLLALAAWLTAGDGRTDVGDAALFAETGRTLLSGHWVDTFARSDVQAGPIQLAAFGALARLAAVLGLSEFRLLAPVLELGSLAALIALAGRLAAPRPGAGRGRRRGDRARAHPRHVPRRPSGGAARAARVGGRSQAGAAGTGSSCGRPRGPVRGARALGLARPAGPAARAAAAPGCHRPRGRLRDRGRALCALRALRTLRD